MLKKLISGLFEKLKGKFTTFCNMLDRKLTTKMIMRVISTLILVLLFMSLLSVIAACRQVSYGTDDRYRYEKWLPDNYTRHIPRVEGTPDNPPYTSVPLVTHNLVCIEGYAFYLISAYKMENGNIILINSAVVPQYEYINGLTIPLICK